MTMYVRQTFLHQAKDHQFHIVRQSPKVLRNIDANVQAAAFKKSLQIPADGRMESVLIQKRRMQQVRGRANLAVQLLNDVLDLFHFDRNFGGTAPGFLNDLSETHAQYGQCLTGAVVQLARNMAPFFVLGSQESPGQCSNLLRLPEYI